MSDGLRYKDKVAIITGGSSGIGKGCATAFVRHGSNVVFCSNNETEGYEAEKEINCQNLSGKATFVYADVTVEKDVQHLVEKTVELYGKIDCVLNNAGWHPPYRTIDDFSVDDFTSLLNQNVVGYFLVSKYSLPYLRKSEGNIINISSMDGHHAAEGSVTYVATKGAVCAMTRALAIDEARYNVRVNTISPGATMTPLFVKTGGPDGMEKAKNVSVLGRVGQPEEIGMSALYLAADATFCTGIDIECSGGTALNYGDKNMRKNVQ